MRLAVKLTLYYLIISLVVFMIGGIITFYEIKDEVDAEQKRFLRERLTHMLKMIERRRPDKPFQKDKLLIIPLGPGPYETTMQFSDTLVMHNTLQRMEPHVKLDAIREVEGRFYKISLYDLIVEEDDIAEGVQWSIIKIYVLLSAVVVVLSFIASMLLLRPFNRTLEAIKAFNIKDEKPLQFQGANTVELAKLHSFLEEMSGRNKKDYKALKEFTENASHEMQTPMSIIKGKLELLLGYNNLTSEQSEMIVAAQDALGRLSKLGTSLSILAKIDNHEFENIEEVKFSEAVNKLLFEFSELFDLKSITLHKEVEPGVKVKMDRVLCDILLSNLLQNSIRHNYQNGIVNIKLTAKYLAISNTGKSPNHDPKLFFERFKKDNQSHESIGLGLSIVKKICEVSGFDIHYTYAGGMHKLNIGFLN